LGTGFRAHAHGTYAALGLTCLAALWVILELFVVKKELFASGEDKFAAAVNALEYSIRIFHRPLPVCREIVMRSAMLRTQPVPFPCLDRFCTTKGPGRERGKRHKRVFWG
jgi:hypothetical protein